MHEWHRIPRQRKAGEDKCARVDGLGRGVPSSTQTWPLPEMPRLPSQPLLLSCQPLRQQMPWAPHHAQAPCRAWQPPQQSLPEFLTAEGGGGVRQGCGGEGGMHGSIRLGSAGGAGRVLVKISQGVRVCARASVVAGR